MFFSKSAGIKLVSCGDPLSADFGVGDFNQDGNEHDLDISAKVPANTKWVFCRFTGSTTNIAYTFTFKPYGNSNDVHKFIIQQKVMATIPEITFLLPVPTDKKIIYQRGGGDWIVGDLTILAWII